jgi:membrane protease YdiL (CAAX protease family)
MTRERKAARRVAVTPVALVRRFPILSFFVLACLVGWIPYGMVVVTGGSGAENFPLGPLAAALVVVSCQGRGELRSWWRGIRTWRAARGWYLLALLAPVALQVLIVLANHAMGAPLPTADQLADSPQVLVTFLVMLVFVGLGEEAGWIAFAAPVLLRRHGILVAWTLAATMRIAWHLPLMISGDLPWILGTVGNAAFTMLMLLVFVASDGRWTLVAVWHAALNAVGGPFFFQMVEGPDRARLGFLLAGVYAVVAVIAVVAYLAGGGHRTRSEDRSPRHRDVAEPVLVDVRPAS